MALYYIATVTLGMSRDEFWRSTLRKLHALHSFHVGMRGNERGSALEQLLG